MQVEIFSAERIAPRGSSCVPHPLTLREDILLRVQLPPSPPVAKVSRVMTPPRRERVPCGSGGRVAGQRQRRP